MLGKTNSRGDAIKWVKVIDNQRIETSSPAQSNYVNVSFPSDATAIKVEINERTSYEGNKGTFIIPKEQWNRFPTDAASLVICFRANIRNAQGTLASYYPSLWRNAAGTQVYGARDSRSASGMDNFVTIYKTSQAM